MVDVGNAAGQIHVFIYYLYDMERQIGVNKLGKRRTYNQKRTREKNVFKESSNIYFIYSHTLHHKKHVKMAII